MEFQVMSLDEISKGQTQTEMRRRLRTGSGVMQSSGIGEKWKLAEESAMVQPVRWEESQGHGTLGACSRARLVLWGLWECLCLQMQPASWHSTWSRAGSQ